MVCTTTNATLIATFLETLMYLCSGHHREKSTTLYGVHASTTASDAGTSTPALYTQNNKVAQFVLATCTG